MGIPATFSALLEKSMEMINTVYIGRRYNAENLAALGLAHSVMNLCCILPMLGFNTGQETLVS